MGFIQRSVQLEDANRKLHRVIDAATDAFIGIDDGGRITDWNRRAEALFGWSRDEILGRFLADTVVPPRHRQAHQRGLSRFLTTGQASILDQRVEITAIDRSGREFPVELTVWAVDDGSGTMSFHAFVHDISDRRDYEDALRESEARYRSLADQLAAAQRTARLGSWEWDAEADRVMWSDELYRLFGVDPSSFVPTYAGYLECVHPGDRALVGSTVGAAFESGEPFAFDHRVVRPDGEVAWIHSRGQVEVGADGRSVCMRGTAADVTERVTLQRELAALALFDQLTGLLNRRGFVTLAEHQLKVAGRADRSLPLLFVDMDGMKAINDDYGHSEGDNALLEVADFLRETFRSSDLMARVGGDEFCILMVDESESGVDVERVLARLRGGPPPGSRPYHLSLSVGIARLEPGSSTSIEDLMSRADGAMYEDKTSQRRQAHILVVEDDAGLRRLAELSLRYSFTVVTAATGSAALREVETHLPDLVLLDLNLPDMNGAEVLRRVRALPGGERVSVIVMTAAAGRATELESLRGGVDDFLAKPLDLDILEARMRNVLLRPSSRRRRFAPD